MKRWIFWVVLGLTIGLFLPFGMAHEGFISMRVIRFVRPHVCIAEVGENGESQRVWIKLAGVKPRLGEEKVYQQAMERARELTGEDGVLFDFALAHGREEKQWVGYIYLPSCERDETMCILNAELLREGLVMLDGGTASRNLLGYLLEAEEEAREKKLGLWAVTPVERDREREGCPSCEIR